MSHEFKHLFEPVMPGEPFCTCDLAAVVMAEINGEPRPLCERHDQAEIKARETATQVADAEAELETARTGFTEVRDGIESDALAKVQAALDRGLRQRRKEADPLTLHIADVAGASPDPAHWDATALNSPDLANRFAKPHDVAIGDDAAFGAILESTFGAGTHNQHDHYDDAA